MAQVSDHKSKLIENTLYNALYKKMTSVIFESKYEQHSHKLKEIKGPSQKFNVYIMYIRYVLSHPLPKPNFQSVDPCALLNIYFNNTATELQLPPGLP